jgi:hypothetical protein
MIEVEQVSLGTVEVEVLGNSATAFEVSAGNPLALEIVLLQVGPAGPPGIQGPPGDVAAFSIGGLNDVTLTAPAEGDVLIYSSNQFRNRPSVELVDGGNF